MERLDAVVGTLEHCPAACFWTPWGFSSVCRHLVALAAPLPADTRARPSSGGAYTLHLRRAVDWVLPEWSIVAYFEVRLEAFLCYAVPPRPVVVRSGAVLRVPRSEA